LGDDAPVRAADARDIGLEHRPEDLLFLVPLGFIGVGAFYLLYFYTVRESTVGTAPILLYSSPSFVVLLV
jgi:drug/metabolite transporter (DMT)-like permease